MPKVKKLPKKMFVAVPLKTVSLKKLYSRKPKHGKGW